MEDSLSGAISQLQNMLSTDEGKKSIESMIESLGMGEASPLVFCAFSTHCMFLQI